MSSTTGGFGFVTPPTSTVVLSSASTLEIVPAPEISVFPLEPSEVEVILSIVASFATSTFAVALSLMTTSVTFAEPSKAISAVALPLTATFFTFAPSFTVTLASPLTSTLLTVAPESTTISAPFSAVTVSTEPFSTWIGALACTFVVVKPTILAAVLAIKLLISFFVSVSVLISTKRASVLSLLTVTLELKLVSLTKVIVHFKLLLAGKTATSAPS